MTIVNESYHNPLPYDNPVVLSALPTGTIYMYGCGRELVKYLIHAPRPEQNWYYLSEQQALDGFKNTYGTSETPKFLEHPSALNYCTVYEVEWEHLPLYIYIWAITQMGGAA